jgi:hypothetical protein
MRLGVERGVEKEVAEPRIRDTPSIISVYHFNAGLPGTIEFGEKNQGFNDV